MNAKPQLFDLSSYKLRQLDPSKTKKPLDIGGDGFAASISPMGRFVAINCYHSEHGYIGLSANPPFPDQLRYDVQKVREYRKKLAETSGFGIDLASDLLAQTVYLIEDSLPYFCFDLANGCHAECISFVAQGAVRQIWQFSTAQEIELTGTFWLMRAAYTQLTEGGIIPVPPVKTNILKTTNNSLQVVNPALGAYASLHGTTQAKQNSDGSIGLAQQYSDVRRIELHIQIKNNEDSLAEIEPFDINSVLEQAKKSNRHYESLVLQRAYRYAEICLLPTDGNAATILTDHMILPLSWNRDAYYVAQMFGRIPESHLDWCFFSTWRGAYCRNLKKPLANAWGRSYMANGKQKDSNAFQLDQQIFPLLEFTDLIQQSSGQEVARLKAKYQAEIIRTLSLIRASELTTGLFPTDETPADDDLYLSFHFSTHVLLWHTLKRLAAIFPELETASLAKQVYHAINQHFVVKHHGKEIFAYATDAKGNHHLYHDANDIPLVMMPLWGFCDKDNPIWRNTLEFAFSRENPAFFGGVLGSVHTPSAWILGDAQELILSKILGDKTRYEAVWQRIETVAQWDGSLPEAYDSSTYEVVSRKWFAWANAMLAIADGLSWTHGN